MSYEFCYVLTESLCLTWLTADQRINFWKQAEPNCANCWCYFTCRTYTLGKLGVVRAIENLFWPMFALVFTEEFTWLGGLKMAWTNKSQFISLLGYLCLWWLVGFYLTISYLEKSVVDANSELVEQSSWASSFLVARLLASLFKGSRSTVEAQVTRDDLPRPFTLGSEQDYFRLWARTFKHLGRKAQDR